MLRAFEQMKIIKRAIKHDFFCHSRPACHFADENLMAVCLRIFSDYHQTYCVLMMNDAGVPPVKAVLMLYRDYYYLKPDKKFSMQDSQNIGCLLTFVFKDVLGYEVKKERAKVGIYGIAFGRVFVQRNPKEISVTEQSEDDGDLIYEIPEYDN